MAAPVAGAKAHENSLLNSKEKRKERTHSPGVAYKREEGGGLCMPHCSCSVLLHTIQHSVVYSQNTGSLSIEIPEHRVLENRNTAQFVSVGEGQMLQFFSSGRL